MPLVFAKAELPAGKALKQRSRFLAGKIGTKIPIDPQGNTLHLG
jgi:hypothetical protein